MNEMSNTRNQAHTPPPVDPINDPGAEDNTPDTTVKKNYDGYPKLANLMSRYHGTRIFRQFGELNALNLLRLQAELQDLEHQLQDIREEDDFAKSQDPVRSLYVTDFRLMRDWKESGDSLQYDLLVSIGEKLREYSKLLLDRLGAVEFQ